MQIIKLIVWHLTLMLYCMNIWGGGFSHDPEKFFVSVLKSKGLLLLCFCSTFCSDYFFPSFPTPQYHIVLLLLSSLIVPRSWEFLPSLPPPFLRWDPMLCCCCVRCWQRWLALSQQRVFTVTVGRKHQSHRAGHTTTTTACVFPTRHSRNTAGFQPLCRLATTLVHRVLSCCPLQQLWISCYFILFKVKYLYQSWVALMFWLCNILIG